MTALVCIGGLADGDRVEIADGQTWIRLVIPRPAQRVTQHGVDVGCAVSYTIYEVHSLHTPAQAFRYLAPHGREPDEHIRMLLAGYHL